MIKSKTTTIEKNCDCGEAGGIGGDGMLWLQKCGQKL